MKNVLKVILRIIGVIWIAFWLIGVIVMLTQAESVIAIVFLIISSIGVIPLYTCKTSKNSTISKRFYKETKCSICDDLVISGVGGYKMIDGFICNKCFFKCSLNAKSKIKKLTVSVIKADILEKSLTTDQRLERMNFNISKKVKINSRDAFYVDDINKKVAVYLNKKFDIYNYNDLGEYELNEDGNSITKGKGLSTAIGGLTFGLAGALIGSSGKRKNVSTCSSLIVRIMVNNLNNSQIIIPYIQFECSKSSLGYITAREDAKNLIATLNYITNQKNIL